MKYFVAEQFDVAGRLVSVKEHGDGNVNDTYIVVFRTTFSEEKFILQRISSTVFAEPMNIIHNMKLLTEHGHAKLEAGVDLADRIWQLPKLIKTRHGDDFIIDEDGNYWRAISLIASAHSYEKVRNIEHAFEVGTVLGKFHETVNDLPSDLLKDPLPGFHETPVYLDEYDKVCQQKPAGKLLKFSKDADNCRRFIEQRRQFAMVLETAKRHGELKLRPIHGDPKISNIMIDDDTGKGTCIVDLDTVKPGLVHYDFGDCMRSCCNPAGEETKNISKVIFDTNLCQAITKGYMGFGRQFLTESDKYYLYDSIRLITFELGLRFFTDYLAGNVYFKTRYDGHNLHRARVQFKLVESIETREDIIREILDRYR
ncbi:MAG: aminoglycoside phosphotransferase family protein [Victivallaceae bacterium]|nr:aminoglycoside phosphotransferase family protein [Victivallaceae bacterium]